jgi:hypothetical protein
MSATGSLEGSLFVDAAGSGLPGGSEPACNACGEKGWAPLLRKDGY